MQSIRNPNFQRQTILYRDCELSYRNNPKSLFRKYAPLLTSLSQHQLFRDFVSASTLKLPKNVSLLLPNGYQQKIRKCEYRLVVTTRPVYAGKLLPALRVINFFDSLGAYATIKEAEKAFLYELEQIKLFANPFGYRYAEARLHYLQSTFNPDANTESTSVDGYVERSGVDEVWSSIRGGSGTTSSDSAATGNALRIATTNASTHFGDMVRSFFLFDTSSLSDFSVIQNTSKLSLYTISPIETSMTDSLAVVDATPASNTALVNSDYSNLGTTLQATAVAISGFSANSYKDITLNSTGDASISLTGITKFGVRNENDRANTEPSWSSFIAAGSGVNFSDNGSNKPVLTVDYVVVSPSASISPSASSSPSRSPSASLSPSSSISASISPSASTSPSSSSSRSFSPSSSLSPSASLSPSVSPSSSSSASVSPSISPSSSSSASLSPSSSSSSSASASVSSSPSATESNSNSPSPSAGFTAYTRGDYAVLPTGPNDLITPYTEQDELNVATENNVRVGQTGALTYMIHEFKNFIGDQSYVEIEFEGTSTLAPRLSPVYLQVYNHATNQWDTFDSNNSRSADIDFELEGKVVDTTNYKDAQNIITARVYQLAI